MHFPVRFKHLPIIIFVIDCLFRAVGIVAVANVSLASLNAHKIMRIYAINKCTCDIRKNHHFYDCALTVS